MEPYFYTGYVFMAWYLVERRDFTLQADHIPLLWKQYFLYGC